MLNLHLAEVSGDVLNLSVSDHLNVRGVITRDLILGHVLQETVLGEVSGVGVPLVGRYDIVLLLQSPQLLCGGRLVSLHRHVVDAQNHWPLGGGHRGWLGHRHRHRSGGRGVQVVEMVVVVLVPSGGSVLQSGGRSIGQSVGGGVIGGIFQLSARWFVSGGKRTADRFSRGTIRVVLVHQRSHSVVWDLLDLRHIIFGLSCGLDNWLLLLLDNRLLLLDNRLLLLSDRGLDCRLLLLDYWLLLLSERLLDGRLLVDIGSL